MRSRLFALLLVPPLLGAGQPIDPRTLAWDSSGGPDIVAGYEVVQGWDGAEVGSTVTGLSVPLAARTGTAYAARVRALPVDPAAQPSNWATLAATWPAVLPQITSLSQLGRTTAPLPGELTTVAASHRSFTSLGLDARTNTTIDKPSGVVDGDILVMSFVMVAAGTPPTPTFPAGWTTLSGPDELSYGGTVANRYILIKQASSEGTTYTVTHASAYSEVVLVAVAGGGLGSSPVAVVSNASGTGTTTTATGITTRTDGAWVGFFSQAWLVWGSGAVPTGSTPTFTERVDLASLYTYFADGVLASAGATGNKAHTNPNAADNPWGAYLISVDAASAAATGLPRRALDGPFYGALRGSVR